MGLELEYLLKRASDRSQDSGVAPLSPTSEVAVTSTSTASSSRVMSSAISNESVAGDSGNTAS